MGDKITKDKYAYLAGIIDGEGTFGIRQRFTPSAKSTYARGYGWEFYVAISNTSIDLIKWLSANFGGCIMFKNGKDNRKDFWRINYYSNALRTMLPNIKLIIKEEHRRLFLEALDIMDKRNHSKLRDKKTNRFIGTKIDSKDEKRLIEILHIIRKLNKRGRDFAGLRGGDEHD